MPGVAYASDDALARWALKTEEAVDSERWRDGFLKLMGRRARHELFAGTAVD
jgi:hypothetical protein